MAVDRDHGTACFSVAEHADCAPAAVVWPGRPWMGPSCPLPARGEVAQAATASGLWPLGQTFRTADTECPPRAATALGCGAPAELAVAIQTPGKAAGHCRAQAAGA